MKTDNNSQIMSQAKKEIKSAIGLFSAAYADNASSGSAEEIFAAVEGQLRIAKRLSQIENFFKEESTPEYADEQSVMQYKIEKSKTYN